VIQDVLAEGERLGLPVTLQVFRNNPARQLYERLGFTAVGRDDIRLFMQKGVKDFTD
jgi:predicted GNAT family acetyltransferase